MNKRMRSPLSVEDALAMLSRSSLPTVLTEGRDDYRVLRKMERRLSDIGVDFLPLSGRSTVLEVWRQIPQDRAQHVLALVDLDDWIYNGIPIDYIGENLIYTIGYSIENDIILDCSIENFLDPHELVNFHAELDKVSADHAIQIHNCISGADYFLQRHVNQIINEPDKDGQLSADQVRLKKILKSNFKQFMRGKSVFQLIVRQTTSKGRHVNLGYNHLYEFASAQQGPIFLQLESRIRSFYV